MSVGPNEKLQKSDATAGWWVSCVSEPGKLMVKSACFWTLLGYCDLVHLALCLGVCIFRKWLSANHLTCAVQYGTCGAI